MPWNLLLVPLVAGYFFLTRSYYFRYKYRLLDRQRLLFESVIPATVFLILAYVTALLLNHVFQDQDWYQSALRSRPFPYTGTAFISFGLALLATYVPHLWLSRDKAMRQGIIVHGNALEKLILSAIEDPQQLCFTLDNGKVYVGYPRFMADLIQTGMLRIYPVLSGYRNKEFEIVFTTIYEDAFAAIDEEAMRSDKVAFEQLVAIDRIISAKRFDLDIYEDFQSQGDS